MPRAITLDPETGELVDLILQTRNGVLYRRRLARSLIDPAHASPGTIQNWLTFAEGARRARGTPFTGPIPPAAEAVRAEFTARSPGPITAITIDVEELVRLRTGPAGALGPRTAPGEESLRPDP